MYVLGLTGSIGMGKSTTAAMFREAGCPVHDADRAVHDLYRGAAVAPVGALFPEAIRNGAVDRAALSALVLGVPERMKELEAVVHPLVGAAERAFLAQSRAAHAPLAVLDIPLLFETGAQSRCNGVLVVTCDPAIQRARVLARPGMTEEKLAAILARQMPDAQKRKRADFIVDTGHGMDAARTAVMAIIGKISDT